jgi:adenylate cyclase
MRACRGRSVLAGRSAQDRGYPGRRRVGLLTANGKSGTLSQLRQLRAEVSERKIAQFHGRIVGSAGDSLLVEFASAVNAVQCAIEVQRELGDTECELA